MSVVGTNNESVYEKLVKPDYPIVDYNTKYVCMMYVYKLVLHMYDIYVSKKSKMFVMNLFEMDNLVQHWATCVL